MNSKRDASCNKPTSRSVQEYSYTAVGYNIIAVVAYQILMLLSIWGEVSIGYQTTGTRDGNFNTSCLESRVIAHKFTSLWRI